MKSSKDKKVIIIVGPTAVGKTAVAISLAKHFHTEIISADSRQCFKELNIGVARPSIEELKQVKHHFIASHSINEKVNAAVFEKFALEKEKKLFQEHDVIIMVGGTGLYIKAFCEGLDEIPPVDPEIRKEVILNYEKKGITWLQEQIKIKDDKFYHKGEIHNPQRLMRALEVVDSTGHSILDFRKGKKITRDFNIIKIGLELSKEELQKNINARVDRMLDSGLLDEVKSLLPYKELNALRTVGYSEIFDYIDKKSSFENSVEMIKQHTRQYAKRQLTWFKKDKDVKWFYPHNMNEMLKALNEIN